MRRFFAGLLILISAVTLVLASTSLWIRHNVINTTVFVSNVETMIDLPEVEARITEQVTTTVMANPTVQDAIDEAVTLLPDRLQTFRPSVESGVRSVISAGVTRLLTNDPFRPLTTAALTSAHDQLVNGQPVEFTLGQAKDRVPASLRDGIAGQVLDLIPDDVGVTILTPADSPQVYSAVDLLKSAWWWLGLVALGTFAGALGVSRRRRGTLRAWAVTTTVLALLVLATLRIGRGLLLPQAKPDNRDAVGAMYDVLAGSLRSWTFWLLGVAVLVLVLTLVWGRLGLVAGARRGIAAARARADERREARAAVGAATVDGVATDGAPAPRESGGRRVAVWWAGFSEGLDLPARTAAAGALVRDHLVQVRWAGIALGAVVLLFWPEPTLSVLVWVGALVALYLGAVAWLVGRAPEAVLPVPADGGAPATGETVRIPVARSAENGVPVPEGVGAGLTGGGAGGTAVATRPDRVATHSAPPAAPEPLVSAALTSDAISVLSGRLDLLVRLRQAKEAGVLTEEEFRREKDRLLGA
jgi:hypothetical protein